MIEIQHGDGTRMAVVDEILIDQIDQTEVDPKTHATTVHTGLNFPDGKQGFIILGQVVRSKEDAIKPLKEIVKRVFVEYYENQVTAGEDFVHTERDQSGSVSDGEQAVSGESRHNTPGRKGRKGVQKGR